MHKVFAVVSKDADCVEDGGVGAPDRAVTAVTSDEFAGYFTVEAGSIRCYPALAAGEELEMLYWQDIPALSDSNTSNWLLASRPDLYLYGALMQAGPYIKDTSAMKVVSDMWGALTTDLKSSDFRKKYGNGTMKVTVRGRR